MALNPKLESFSKFPKVKQFNKVLKYMERELNELSTTDWTIDLFQVEKDGSALSRFLSFKLTDDSEPDQLMIVAGSHNSRMFRVIVAINEGGTLPYNLEIALNAPINDIAEYKKAFVGKKWELESGDDSKAKQLNKLKIQLYLFNKVGGSPGCP